MPSLDEALLESDLAAAGPLSRPVLRRSAYLAQALQALRQGASQNIRSPGSLASNLLATALLEYGRSRQDKKLSEAERQDATNEAEAMARALGGGDTPLAPPVQVPAGVPTQPLAPSPAPMPQPAAQPAPAPAQQPAAGLSPPLQGMQFFTGQGFAPHQAAGLVGNFMQESGPNLSLGNPAEGAIGMANWQGPRRAALENFARQQGKDPNDLGVQLQFTMSELNGPEARSMAALKGAPDVNAAVNAGLMYERPGIPATDKRLAYANQVLQQFNALPPPSPAGAPSPPVGAPPAAALGAPVPAAGGPPGLHSRGLDSITPEQRSLLQAWMMSGDPRLVAKARSYFAALMQKAAEPTTFQMANANGVPIAYNPQNPSETQPISIPQGARDTVKSAQELGIPAPPGTYFSVDPFGKATPLFQPPQGYQSGTGGVQSPTTGGPADPASGLNRLQGLKDMRGELKPILDLATSLKRNVSAVRAGFNQHNGPGDIAMVNGLQKLIDEGVVREGDVNLQLQAQGLQGGIAGAMAYLNSSGRFDDRIRSQVAAAAESLYGAMNDTYRQRAMGYRGIVERTYGAGSFNDVLPPETVGALGWDQPAQPGAAPGQAAPSNIPQGWTREQLMAAQPYRGSKAQLGSKDRPYVPTTQEQFDKLPRGSWYIDDDGFVGQKR